MSQLNLLALELTQALLFVCSLFFFPPTPLIVLFVAIRKCAIPLSESLDDHRPRLKCFEEVDVTGGGYGHKYSYSNISLSFSKISYALANIIFSYKKRL